MRARSSLLSLAPILLVVSGCRSHDDPRGMPPATAWKAPEATVSDVEARAAAVVPSETDDEPGDPHAGLDMSGAGGEVDPAMANLQPPDPDRPIDASKVVRGTIRADAGLAERIAAGSILFLTAWPIDPATEEVIGSPVAVARLTVDKLPIDFELSERDGMIDGTRFDGVVMVDARVDTDGDGEARTRGPDDLAGRARARVPETKLELVLRPR